MRKCVACLQENRANRILEKEDPRFKELLELVKCSNCGHVFLNDVPEIFDSRQYKYYKKYRGLPESQVFNKLTTQRHLADLARFRQLTPVKSILDVGCGKGDFIWALKDENLACLGIDLATDAVEVAQTFGLNVIESDFFSVNLECASLDVITMYELIEHVPNPVQFMQRARDLLRPGGVLYLTTPNFNSVDRFVLKARWPAIHGEHLSYFTPKSMRVLVGQICGLELCKLRTDNLSLELANIWARKIGLKKRKTSDANALSKSTQVEAIAERKGIREDIESSKLLRSARDSLNFGLNASRLGSSMKVLCRKSSVN